MSKKTKLIATLMAMCLVISLGVIGILAVRTLNMKIGGNITFNAEGIAFTVGEGKFYEDDATTIYTGISSQTGKMQGFSMDTDTKLTDVSEAIATWTELELEVDERGDAILKFNVSNDMDDSELYVIFEIKHGTNTNDNMLIKTELLQTISAGDDKDIEITFDILDMDLNAGLEGFEISVTFADKVEVNNAGTVSNQTIPALANAQYTVTNTTSKTVSAQMASEDVSGAVIIPETVYIGDVPYTVTSVPESAFNSCSGITSLYIPGTVTSIEDGAFSGCHSLTTVQFSEGLEYIGADVFDSCYMISGEVNFPDSLISVGDSAFLEAGTDGAGFRLNLGNGIELIDGGAFSSSNIVGEVVIPNSVHTLKAAFVASKLTGVYISKNVTTISDGVLRLCANLQSITVEQGNTKYHSAGNCLIETANFRLAAGCNNSIIPTDGSVKTLGGCSFNGLRLKRLVIPASVTAIESTAIEDCESLQEVIVESTTPPTIKSISTNTNMTIFEDTNNCPIRVPAASINLYKAADVWKNVASRIVAI